MKYITSAGPISMDIDIDQSFCNRVYTHKGVINVEVDYIDATTSKYLTQYLQTSQETKLSVDLFCPPQQYYRVWEGLSVVQDRVTDLTVHVDGGHYWECREAMLEYWNPPHPWTFSGKGPLFSILDSYKNMKPGNLY